MRLFTSEQCNIFRLAERLSEQGVQTWTARYWLGAMFMALILPVAREELLMGLFRAFLAVNSDLLAHGLENDDIYRLLAW